MQLGANGAVYLCRLVFLVCTMFDIREAGELQAGVIQQLAEDTWFNAYGSILPAVQIRYMLDHIYDKESIRQQIVRREQQYLILFEADAPVAFASFAPRKENRKVYKLHKLYCIPGSQGKGYGRALLQEVEHRVLQQGCELLELNVNRYNRSKVFYEYMGYLVIYEEDIPIGDYWMNDYVMRKNL